MQTQVPSGALTPGTKLTVGSHQVTIKTYISEGGFAHVYVVYCNPVENGSEIACLKRVQVPDKVQLNLLRAEVDAMKRLKGHPNIVKYIDSHAARMPDGSGYEVLLLMEYCSGNGLIDFMNTRLREQLKEHEILKIMYDITYGLSSMHYLQPALLHRDLKIENVLIAADGTFKLCDFGSSSPVLRPPRNPQEYHILEEDIQRHTTAQYRSPEMIDIYRGFPIDEKSDIWALGVFLYKLCYYITPFEREGQLAILHAKYTFPARPDYSERLKRMMQATLREDPRNRPNVYQVMKEVCSMRGVDVPIKDIYTEAMQKMQLKQQQEQQQKQQDQQQQTQSQPLAVKPAPVKTQGVHAVAHAQKEQIIPEITPMYRGRLKTANPVTQQSNSSVALNSINSSQPESSAVFSDPFALLDSGVRTGPASTAASKRATPAPPDEISARYPTVDELSKNLEQSGYFFDSPSITPITSRTGGHTPFDPVVTTMPPTSAVPVAQSIAHAQQNILYQPQPQMPVQIASKTPNFPAPTTATSIPKFQYSSASPPLKSNPLSKSAPSPNPSSNFNTSPNLLDSSSDDDDDEDYDHPDPPLPARPSPRPRSTQPVQSRQRPVSMYQIQSASYSQEGNLIDTVPPGDRDELKAILTGLSQRTKTMVLDDDDDDTHIDSNVQFLKSMEDDQAVSRKPSSHHHSRKPSGALGEWKSIRRSASAASRKSGELSRKSGEFARKSMEPPAVPARKSIESTQPRKSLDSLPRKSLDDDSVRRAMRRTGSGHNKKASMNSFKGMFKFDNNGSSKSSRADKERERERERDLELQYERERERERDRERELELERQRELERKEWSQRAKYTSTKYADSNESLGISSDDDFKFPKPIQARVNSFLNQQMAESPPKRTAQGYGRFTDSPKAAPEGKSSSSNGNVLSELSAPSIPRRPQTVSVSRHTRQLSAISSASSSSEGKRPPPVKPIKPVHLRSRPSSRTNTLVSSATHTDSHSGVPADIQETDWEAKFNQKYPSLN